MNNKGEIYKALNDGEKIRSVKRGKGFIHLVEGWLLNHSGGLRDIDFKTPADWQIYQESEWYEHIPPVVGVLCHVCEQADWDEFEDTPRIITEYKNNTFYDSDGVGWPHAKPLPKKMIQVLAYNAPEEL